MQAIDPIPPEGTADAAAHRELCLMEEWLKRHLEFLSRQIEQGNQFLQRVRDDKAVIARKVFKQQPDSSTTDQNGNHNPRPL